VTIAGSVHENWLCYYPTTTINNTALLSLVDGDSTTGLSNHLPFFFAFVIKNTDNNTAY
jgi:hypothetical protein